MSESQNDPPRDQQVKGGCPSKSTVYVANLNYCLTNNDLAQLLGSIGKIVSTRITKDRITGRSKGYAFVQFLKEEDAKKCIQQYDKAEVFGRIWSCSIARDNGRTREFIKKRTYPDKSRCFECREVGHLSYTCSKNALGDRAPPQKKRKHDDDENSSEDGESGPFLYKRNRRDHPGMDSLGAAIAIQREKMEAEEYRDVVVTGNYAVPRAAKPKRRKFETHRYFSDEEVLTDEDE